MTRPGDGGSSGPPAGDSPGSQSTTYKAHGHCWWPQGDPDKLDAAAAAWEAAAAGVKRVAGDGDTAVRSVTTHNSGDAIQKFSAFWAKYYSGGSDTATLTQSAEACLQIAHVCREYADGIRRTRKEVIALAAAAAATVAVGLVLTFVSFGASDVAAEAAAAEITAEALTLEETFSTLIMGVVRTAISGALNGAVYSMEYDVIIVQPIQMHFEPGRHFSIDEVGEWGLAGAAVGSLWKGVPATVRAAKMARMLKLSELSAAEVDEEVAAAADALPKGESGLPDEGESPAVESPPAVPSASSLATDVAEATGGELAPLKSGYRITIPRTPRDIVVRVMESGGGRTNYYRISLRGAQTYTVTGEVSIDRALTHIDIGATSLEDLLRIIKSIG